MLQPLFVKDRSLETYRWNQVPPPDETPGSDSNYPPITDEYVATMIGAPSGIEEESCDPARPILTISCEHCTLYRNDRNSRFRRLRPDR